MTDAHRIVGHVAASPLARIRTLSFEPRRREILKADFIRCGEDPTEENLRYAAGAIILDEWLTGSITMSRGFTMEEVWHLRHLLILWAIDWLRTFEEMSEEIAGALERANRWIGEHGPPGGENFPFDWAGLKVERKEEAR